MPERSILKLIFPSNTPKHVARLMDVPLETARTWVYRKMSNARRRELAEKLLIQIDKDRGRFDAIERQLLEIARGHND
jgi:hypothetical protein